MVWPTYVIRMAFLLMLKRAYQKEKTETKIVHRRLRWGDGGVEDSTVMEEGTHLERIVRQIHCKSTWEKRIKGCTKVNGHIHSINHVLLIFYWEMLKGHARLDHGEVITSVGTMLNWKYILTFRWRYLQAVRHMHQRLKVKVWDGETNGEDSSDIKKVGVHRAGEMHQEIPSSPCNREDQCVILIFPWKGWGWHFNPSAGDAQTAGSLGIAGLLLRLSHWALDSLRDSLSTKQDGAVEG